jgi:hypothetical protein
VASSADPATLVRYAEASPADVRTAGFKPGWNVHSSDMTIPYVGRCLGSGKPPREGTEESQGDGKSGICVACSGRFDLHDGTVVDHETAPEDERESVDEVQA